MKKQSTKGYTELSIYFFKEKKKLVIYTHTRPTNIGYLW